MLYIILGVVILIVVFALWPKQDKVAPHWREAEEAGEVQIIGSEEEENPTLAFPMYPEPNVKD